MRVFQVRELKDAIAYAAAGGQALHLHRILGPRPPACFRRDVEQGKDIAHLFDQDKERLVATVRRLGVRVIKVEREGTSRQHIDLCGVPLQKAIGQSNAQS
jgi:hypothetical protein